MFCRFCGKNILDNSVFCPYCGKSLAIAEVAAPEEDQSTTCEEPIVQQEVPAPAQTPAPSVTPSQHTSYIPSVLLDKPTPAQKPARQPKPKRQPKTHRQPESGFGKFLYKTRFILPGCVLLVVLLVLFFTKVLCFHRWEEATCTNPITCARCEREKGEALGHKCVDATCLTPRTCTVCDMTFGNELGHSWRQATCANPATCFRCGITTGEPLEHQWIAATKTTPKTCEDCGKMEAMMPDSGTVYINNGRNRYSQMTIHAARGQSLYIKMKTESGEDIFSFYAKAGQTTTVNVPTGHYYIYFASGHAWYGPEHLFGPNTRFTKDNELLDFSNYTWTFYLDGSGNEYLTRRTGYEH